MEVEKKRLIDIDCWLGYKFFTVDNDEELWFHFLRKHNISYKIEWRMVHPDYSYQLLTLRVRKRYKKLMDKIAKEVEDTFVLMGFTDYVEFRDNLFDQLLKGDKKDVTSNVS